MKRLDIIKALCMTDYNAYVNYVQGDSWVNSRFHRFLCTKVQEFLEEDTGHAIDFLILSCPPQHGKSATITETLPSWYLGKYPDRNVIEVSYNEEYAKKFGRRNRSKIKEFGKEIFDVYVTPDVDTVTAFELNNGKGGMISCGILTGITGNPAHLVIIDDPVKNMAEADSVNRREQVWEEYLASIRTRIKPGGKLILILTRWHEDDLAARIINSEKNVTVINLPLEAEENDPLGRPVGAPLCPELGRDEKWLVDYKAGFLNEAGSRVWNALMQGHPTGLEGNLFKREWWGKYEVSDDSIGNMVDWTMSVDATFKDNDDSDFVAIQVWAKNGANIYLVDAVKRHLNLPDTMREILRLRSLYPQCHRTLIEDKANGSAIISMLRNQIHGIVAVNPKGGKYSRAEAIVGAVESGNVYLPTNRHFTGDFIDECASFPNGAHDDQVDCMTQALNHLVYQKATRPKPMVDDPIMKFFSKKRSRKGYTERGNKISVI